MTQESHRAVTFVTSALFEMAKKSYYVSGWEGSLSRRSTRLILLSGGGLLGITRKGMTTNASNDEISLRQRRDSCSQDTMGRHSKQQSWTQSRLPGSLRPQAHYNFQYQGCSLRCPCWSSAFSFISHSNLEDFVPLIALSLHASPISALK